MWKQLIAFGLVTTAGAVTSFAHQDPPKPQVLALAKPMSAAEAAVRLSGKWKLNEELSPLRAASSPSSSGQDGSQNGRRSPGQGGGPQAYETRRLIEERNIKFRALYRELEIAPATLALTISVATAKFVDQDQAERLVNINQKKEKLDLGTSTVDSRARWDGTALTIELDGGTDLKLVEIFELSPTGTQMLVTIRAGDAHDKNAQGLRGLVQRVYDRVNAGRP